ncbi:hypothetical protein DSCA_24980 [Desulfosarcina alkanivorans]|uniref:Uncharacterized protein n=1 Tax=Desulfosarcina alkanivorans TaxID=571177 RepID=A0A5K7YHZ7_9BACT|nr:hypothetical protein DSCA_24980 [Desulfosarcina alkanivorans]
MSRFMPRRYPTCRAEPRDEVTMWLKSSWLRLKKDDALHPLPEPSDAAAGSARGSRQAASWNALHPPSIPSSPL